MVERMIFRMMSRTFENNLRQTVPEDRHDHTVYYSGSNVDELKEVLQVCERPPHTHNLLAASDCTFPPFTQFFFLFFSRSASRASPRQYPMPPYSIPVDFCLYL